MKKINPLEFYSAMRAQEILGMKARQTLVNYIFTGQLPAVIIGKENSGKRYGILGSDLILFKEKYDKGELQTEKYSVERLKMVLNAARKYCKDNDIETLQDFETSVKKLK